MHTRRWVVIMLGVIAAAAQLSPQFGTEGEIAEGQVLTNDLITLGSMVISAVMGGIDLWQKQKAMVKVAPVPVEP